jgi:hypothetical protein
MVSIHVDFQNRSLSFAEAKKPALPNSSLGLASHTNPLQAGLSAGSYPLCFGRTYQYTMVLSQETPSESAVAFKSVSGMAPTI